MSNELKKNRRNQVCQTEEDHNDNWSSDVLFPRITFNILKKEEKKLGQTWLGLKLGKNLNNQSTNQPIEKFFVDFIFP